MMLPADWLSALRELGTKAAADVTGYSLDRRNGDSYPERELFVCWWNLDRQCRRTQNSLAQLQRSLDVIVNQINLDAANNDQFGWEAERVGFRIVLKPTFGSSDTLANSFATTPQDAASRLTCRPTE